MALTNFADFDDMFGRMDRMVNNVVRNVFGGNHDPFEMVDNRFNSLMMRPSYPPFPDFGSSISQMFSPQALMGGFPGNISGNVSYSSSVMSISHDINGRPQIYQASESSRVGPQGVRETRSSVRDSASGLQKMSIGHHISDRAHIVEKSKNYYTGEEEHQDQYVNLEEEEGRNFEEEWKRRMYAYQPNGYRSIQNGNMYQGEKTLALPAPPVANATAVASTSSNQQAAIRSCDAYQDSGDDSIQVLSHHSPSSSQEVDSQHSHQSVSRGRRKMHKKGTHKREKKPYKKN